MFPEYFLLLLFTECFIFHCRFLKFSYVDFESQASRPNAPLRLSINNTCKKLVSFISIINVSLHPYILAKKFNKLVNTIQYNPDLTSVSTSRDDVRDVKSGLINLLNFLARIYGCRLTFM